MKSKILHGVFFCMFFVTKILYGSSFPIQVHIMLQILRHSIIQGI